MLRAEKTMINLITGSHLQATLPSPRVAVRSTLALLTFRFRAPYGQIMLDIRVTGKAVAALMCPLTLPS